jgi:hypothetical protein
MNLLFQAKKTNRQFASSAMGGIPEEDEGHEGRDVRDGRGEEEAEKLIPAEKKIIPK